MTPRKIGRHAALRALVANERHPQKWRDRWAEELQTLDDEQARLAADRWNRMIEETAEHARRRRQEKAR